MKTTFIYALKDPRTNIVRYVGKANDPYKRYQNHINKCRDKNTHKRNWINNLKQEKLKPILEILEEVPVDKWKEFEKMYIKKYKDAGCDLMNYTEGGDGCTFANKTSFKKGDNARKIVMLDKNGNLIKTFDKGIDACVFIGVKGINHILSKKRKTTKNMIFFYEDEYIKMNENDIKEHINWIKPKILVANKTSFKEVEILQYELNGNFIRCWKSLAEASKTLNINKVAICHCAKGKTKSSGGFFWSYKK